MSSRPSRQFGIQALDAVEANSEAIFGENERHSGAFSADGIIIAVGYLTANISLQ